MVLAAAFLLISTFAGSGHSKRPTPYETAETLCTMGNKPVSAIGPGHACHILMNACPAEKAGRLSFRRAAVHRQRRMRRKAPIGSERGAAFRCHGRFHGAVSEPPIKLIETDQEGECHHEGHLWGRCRACHVPESGRDLHRHLAEGRPPADTQRHHLDAEDDALLILYEWITTEARRGRRASVV